MQVVIQRYSEFYDTDLRYCFSVVSIFNILFPPTYLVHVNGANLGLAAHHILGKPIAVHGLDVGEDLAGKGLVVLQHVDVLNGDTFRWIL